MLGRSLRACAVNRLAARLMGIRASGTDLSPRMIAGARANMRPYRLPLKLRCSDILKFKPRQKFDAVVVDLPYGRGAVIRGKKPNSTPACS
jgi:tRNA G10  N-methylase Trm11